MQTAFQDDVNTWKNHWGFVFLGNWLPFHPGMLQCVSICPTPSNNKTSSFKNWYLLWQLLQILGTTHTNFPHDNWWKWRQVQCNNSFVTFSQYFTNPSNRGSLWDISQSTTTNEVTIPHLITLPTIIFKFLLQHVPCTLDKLFQVVSDISGDPTNGYNKDNFFLILK